MGMQTQALREPTEVEINNLVGRTVDFYEGLFLQEYGEGFREVQLLGRLPNDSAQACCLVSIFPVG